MKNAVFIPLEVLSQQDLPLYVKLVYGRIACMLGKNDRVVMTTDEIAMQCGIRLCLSWQGSNWSGAMNRWTDTACFASLNARRRWNGRRSSLSRLRIRSF